MYFVLTFRGRRTFNVIQRNKKIAVVIGPCEQPFLYPVVDYYDMMCALKRDSLMLTVLQ